MSHALKLAPNGRILSVTKPQYAPASQPRVESIPAGNIADYLYVNGEFIYSPVANHNTQPDEITLLRAQIQALSDRNDFMEDCIAEMAMLIYA